MSAHFNTYSPVVCHSFEPKSLRMRTTHFVLLLTVGLLACTKPEKTETHDHQHSLELNGTEKWQISPGMSPYLRQSMEIIEQANATDSKDYKTIAAGLDSAKNSLVSSCDMMGESHDALHAWLVPYMDLLESLSNAQNDEEAHKVWKEINKSKDDFFVFFELADPSS
jgi:hypothetical protein